MKVQRYNVSPVNSNSVYEDPAGALVFASDYDALAAELEKYKDFCAVMYQVLGVVGAPDNLLDAAHDAASGNILDNAIDTLLPVREVDFNLAPGDTAYADLLAIVETFKELKPKLQAIIDRGAVMEIVVPDTPVGYEDTKSLGGKAPSPFRGLPIVEDDDDTKDAEAVEHVEDENNPPFDQVLMEHRISVIYEVREKIEHWEIRNRWIAKAHDDKGEVIVQGCAFTPKSAVDAVLDLLAGDL
jgi:hypothetical protein